MVYKGVYRSWKSSIRKRDGRSYRSFFVLKKCLTIVCLWCIINKSFGLHENKQSCVALTAKNLTIVDKWRVVRAGRRSIIGNDVYGLKPVSRVRIPYSPLLWPVSQVVKTPAFHAGIVGSNPARVTFGGLAQLGEHLPYKQGVTGSSPVSSITT